MRFRFPRQTLPTLQSAESMATSRARGPTSPPPSSGRSTAQWPAPAPGNTLIPPPTPPLSIRRVLLLVGNKSHQISFVFHWLPSQLHAALLRSRVLLPDLGLLRLQRRVNVLQHTAVCDRHLLQVPRSDCWEKSDTGPTYPSRPSHFSYRPPAPEPLFSESCAPFPRMRGASSFSARLPSQLRKQTRNPATRRLGITYWCASSSKHCFSKSPRMRARPL